MTNIVFLFCGKAGSGKDTSYKIFRRLFQKSQSTFNIKNYAFGSVLKKIVVELSQLYLGTNYSVEEMDKLAYKESIRPEHTIYIDNEPSPLIIRRLLQHIGTNILRNNLGPTIFADSVVSDIDKQFRGYTDQIAMITDLRFPNEYDIVRNYCSKNDYKCYTIYIERNYIKESDHPSEQYFSQIIKDYQIINNGTLEELEKNLSLCMPSM
jgi:hypothetical protein